MDAVGPAGPAGATVPTARIQLLLTAAITLANAIGAAVVVALVLGVLPGTSLFVPRLRWINVAVLPSYVVGALVLGAVVGTVIAKRDLRWAIEERPPSEGDLRATLTVPWRLTLVQAALWVGALVLFGTLEEIFQPSTLPQVAFPIAFGGVTVCANAYLLSERVLRPVAARALLAGDPPPRRAAVGVRGRTILAWALGSGVPVAGLMTLAVYALALADVSPSRLAVSVLALGGVTLVFGLLLTLLSANAVVAPLASVRSGLADVQRGDLDTRIVVFDGTELGRLQSGFNAMASGLAERERLRDLFGRHVGRDVAAAAIGRAPELGGEERTVAAFFVDVVGSTTLATERAPGEVVAMLNRFFTVVVEEVERHGGIVNKFEGDGALAVFGAPTSLDDPAGAALAAVRAMTARLGDEVAEVRTGTGVSAGRAVAGNVGDARRFEYTVIGDPVNEAARLADLAKERPDGVLVSGAAIDMSAAGERSSWRQVGHETLRGRRSPTALWAPLDGGGPAQ